MNILQEIRKVFNVQANSVKLAGTFVDGEFTKAIRLIMRCQSKVVVTGIGKSGLVAQKMASTLSSTGTPAIYLHPVEGMHGNLGVVHKDDVIIAIGKSGESEELLNILPSLRKIGAKIISITANKNSSLAKKSNIVLDLPITQEACPLNLAPTTSSTVALVAGDAIAIALMKLRGFGPEKFALFHPGGLLGKKLLLKISDIMRSGRQNPVVKVNDSVMRLLVEISKKWTGAASVVDRKGKFIGLVTDYDIRKAFSEGRRLSEFSIRDIMNPKPIFVYEDEMAMRALEIMESRSKPLTVLPVINRKRKSVGMIHLHDLVIKGLTSSPNTNQ